MLAKLLSLESDMFLGRRTRLALEAVGKEGILVRGCMDCKCAAKLGASSCGDQSEGKASNITAIPKLKIALYAGLLTFLNAAHLQPPTFSSNNDPQTAFKTKNTISISRVNCKVPLETCKMSHNKVLHYFRWKKHLSSILVANGYPSSFEQRVTKTKTASTDPPTEFRSTAVLRYVTGLSKQLCCCLQQQGECTVFKSETTL
ncbi:hypothetical protein pdam_00005369 [Pocillopora damicornis]|uniref:Uncharacterized protein n=1 Tax=Pocillopora damicornis TaxID=46731 RepID=A0A3M6U2P5_POCDA|nr:hypothetical protein pdam_00005369 [Pocillopora damicornis]